MEIEKSENQNIGQGWSNGTHITISVNKDEIMKMEADPKYNEIKLLIGKRLHPSTGSKSDYFVRKINKSF